MSINGSPESGATRMGVPIVDLATGLSATIGVLLALAERNRSGAGQFVDATLYDTAVSLLHPHASNWFISGNPPRRSGNAHPNIVPYDKYPTRTCEVFLGIGNNGQFRKFCDYLGKPALATDHRFADNSDRIANRTVLRELLEAELSHVDGHVLCENLIAAGVPAGPVLSIPEVLTHPHMLHRQMAITTDAYTGTGIPDQTLAHAGKNHQCISRVWQHTREVLAAHGYDENEIQALLNVGVVIAAPAD
jgi:crotonobetainyl-CoA:carnitine CoA-transferase CaiB-like acyl-CoA transferase